MKKLDRSLGLSSVVAVSISAMIGSGIFVLPGLATALAGPGVWLAYVGAAVAVLPAALSKSELSTAMPTAGGSYVFLDRCFGPLSGTVAGMALWLSLGLKSAFALVGMSAYLAVLTDVPGEPIALGALALIVSINLVGVSKVGKALIVIAAVSVIALAAMIAAAVPISDAAHFADPFPFGPQGLLAAAGLVFLSYDGVTKVASIAEEVEQPARNIPRGILLSLLVVATLYAAVAAALVGVIPAETLHTDIRPIHTLAVSIGGSSLGVAAAVLGVITLASMANAGLLAASRYPFAMSRGKVLPALFGRLHRRFGTPHLSIVATGVMMAAIIVAFDVEAIAKLASATVLSIFVAENVAVIAFRESRARWYRPGWRSPFYPWTQLVGAGLAALLLLMLGWTSLLGILAAVVPGLILYGGYGRARVARQGVFGLLGRRDADPDARRSRVPPAVEGTTSSGDAAAVVADAPVLVALLGQERSPEMLAEVGTALADGERTAVIDVQQVHEETVVDAVREDDARALSLARRLDAASAASGSPIDFEVHLTRDPPASLDTMAANLHCRWVVMAWQTRGRLLLPYNPLGWMLDHIDANVAHFRDVGIRYVRNILVDTEGDALDPLVFETAEHLADVWGASITVARWLPEGASESRRAEVLAELEGLRHAGEHVEGLLLDGADEVAAYAEASAGFDLLVASREKPSGWQLLRKTRHERIATASACSVLLVQPPKLHERSTTRSPALEA